MGDHARGCPVGYLLTVIDEVARGVLPDLHATRVCLAILQELSVVPDRRRAEGPDYDAAILEAYRWFAERQRQLLATPPPPSVHRRHQTPPGRPS